MTGAAQNGDSALPGGGKQSSAPRSCAGRAGGAWGRSRKGSNTLGRQIAAGGGGEAGLRAGRFGGGQKGAGSGGRIANGRIAKGQIVNGQIVNGQIVNGQVKKGVGSGGRSAAAGKARRARGAARCLLGRRSDREWSNREWSNREWSNRERSNREWSNLGRIHLPARRIALAPARTALAQS